MIAECTVSHSLSHAHFSACSFPRLWQIITETEEASLLCRSNIKYPAEYKIALGYSSGSSLYAGQD